jgi:hypothetical protein
MQALLTGYDDQKSSPQVGRKIDRATNIIGRTIKGHPQRTSKAASESEATDTDPGVGKYVIQSMLANPKNLLSTHGDIANATAMQLFDFGKQRLRRVRPEWH